MSDAVVLLGVTGSVAAYKAVGLARCLLRSGYSVQPIVTRSALEFVGAATWLGITQRPALCETFDGQPGERHVQLWQNARAMIIAPATADVLSRLAHGRASDLLTATALCRRGPLFVAPAMHPAMWANPAVSRNVDQLVRDGIEVLGPAEGEVASGDVGMGRMLEPEDLAETVQRALEARDLSGLSVLVSAGPTQEDIDPVRFIGNRSSGKMGFALARAARSRGATVRLVTGPVTLAVPDDVAVERVRSAAQMQAALTRAAEGTDIVLMAAAVADFRPAAVAAHKLPKADVAPALELLPNPDIIAGLAQRRQGRRPVLVAFSLGTGNDEQIVALARQKLSSKGVDLVVANAAADALQTETNRAHLVTTHALSSLERTSKLVLAHAILDRALELYREGTPE
jgi:phosphopantothenoylcysteine decarboxylase/phosphopantothenate--cysteine ligase